MPLDSLTLRGLTRELNETLAQARVDKIYMPRRDQIVLNLRTEQGTARLLIAAGGDARVHLTAEKPDNPDSPPMLCMLLRKHMGGGRITAVHQPGYERIVEICFTATDELGVIAEKKLVCELMGRLTNVILVGGDGTVLACMKPVDYEMSSRAVLPGLLYRLPPAQEKPMLFELPTEEIAALCSRLDMENAAEYISARTCGLSPLLLRECIHRADGDADALCRQLQQVSSMEPRPYMLTKEDGSYADFSCMEITQYSDRHSVEYPGFSQLLDEFYRERSHKESIKNASSALTKTMTAVKNRLVRKLALQQQELQQACKREELKKKADLITANLYAIKPGDTRIILTDYFTEGLPQVEVQLDGQLSPQENAQRLYKKYTRMKNAQQALEQQIALGQQELEYVESVLYNLSSADQPKEIVQIRQELLEAGYVKKHSRDKQRPKAAAFAPRQFALDGGAVAYCGRNNMENDQLTHRQSAKHDLWLHARNIPGSHVVVRQEGGELSDRALEQAAAIAAYYSSGAKQPRVAVDYTLVKHVKKPQGARPGMVNYFQYQTILIEPALPQEGDV